eukprot:TRINITY_DN1363_c0_g1_i2.p1 TRINITY_DN1363_c0_g1~~TRINITY_DN1363_c0_g1_i2.p1  ORF type:complete len:126 (+),score=8.31 TRINITY_DN1363_c0_g1_i2:222-599(+)
MTSTTWVKFVGTVGAVFNWSIPIAGITSIVRNESGTVDPVMSGTLAVYSTLFMRWALAIHPTNYPLFFCHLTNTLVQAWQVKRGLTDTVNSEIDLCAPETSPLNQLTAISELSVPLESSPTKGEE